jgi:hypothetical protein
MSIPPNEPDGQHNGNENRQEQQARRGQGVFDSLASALRKGADDARKQAEEAMPKIKAAAADAAYWTAYAVSFAAVFQWTLVKQFTPESVKKGGRDGAREGKKAAEDWTNELRRKKETASTPPPMQAAGPAGESPQPGPA